MEQEDQKKAFNDELRAYKKLDKINGSAEFDAFFDLQVDTVVKKMLDCFTEKGPVDWNEFCKLRGEVVGILYPIQQVRGANFMVKKLKEQLEIYYNDRA